MYYSVRPDIYYDYCLLSGAILPDPDISFRLGRIIADHIDTPMKFESNFTAENPPKALVGLTVPLFSKDLIEILSDVGVDNLQCFEASIKNKDEKLEWTDYFAVNVIGIVSGADMSKSKYTEIMKSPSGVPLAGFHDLVLDGSKDYGLYVFRLAENPGELLFHEKIISALKTASRPGGWGITTSRVKQS